MEHDRFGTSPRLAAMFHENFRQFEGQATPEVAAAAPPGMTS